MNKDNDSNEKRKRRIITEIIIAIIIILLLLTSCTAMNYFGRVGKVTKQTNTDITNNTGDLETIRNKNLIFDVNDINSCITINMKNGDYKLSYSISGIKPKKYSCTTSDSKIATCVVEDGYIRIKPKKKGTVTITLSTKVNGKKYVTTIDATIIGNKKSSGSDNSSNSNKSNNKKSGGSNSSNNGSGSSSNIKPISKDKDARLKTLTVDGYNLAPTFNPDVYNYVVTIPSDVDSVTIGGKTNSSKASIISGLGEIDLTGVTSKTVKIKVKAEDGTTKTYTIKINKKDDPTNLSSDATLKTIVASGYSLNPDFKSTTYTYDITVPYEVTSLDLSAIANDSNALVTISGNSNFKVGDNKVTIKVTAEDGTTKTYTLNVNRLNKNAVTKTNANLKELEIDTYTLSPSFDPETYLYNVTVPASVKKLDFTSIVPDDSTATYEVTGNSNFKRGENTVNIRVTTTDGIEKTYTIIVNREADTKSTLSSLKVNYNSTDHDMDEAFDPDDTLYHITVPHNISSVDMIYETTDSNATVTVTGNTGLVAGEYNDVKVVVTAEDGITKTEYVVKVYREEDLSAYYVNSKKEYKVGFRRNNPTPEDNYKTIIIDSNLLDGAVTASKVGDKLILSDGSSSIELESSTLDLEYIEDPNSSTGYTIKVSYTDTGVQTLTVTGYRKGVPTKHLIDSFDVTFNVVEIFNVVIDAKTNGGFFNEFADTYNLTFYYGEELDLSVYNEAYKFFDKTNCTSYKFLGYNTDKDATSAIYPAVYDNTDKKYSVTGTREITSDVTLYAIFDSSNDTVEYKSHKKLYLADVDIFVVDGGINLINSGAYQGEYLIYPGAEGAYIMTLNNTTDGVITLEEMEIEENEICEDGACLNIGYVVKHSDANSSSYNYLLGSSTSYYTLTQAGHDKVVDLGNIEIPVDGSTEISLLWKWVHDDVNDTKIGSTRNDTNNQYKITISYRFTKTDTSCEVD